MDVKRTDRLNELVRETVAEIIIKRIKDPRVQGVTITGAAVSRDLRHAKIFFTVYDGPDAYKRALSGLERAEHNIRAEMSKLIKLKYTPVLHFEPDKAIEEGMKIDALIKQLHEGIEHQDED